ncbi:MAG: zinc-binding dehydrogenase [Marinosulfonomonas sp.]|nr:zinc-binding dehydrogenase [Marinosulfonomonas sp.]
MLWTMVFGGKRAVMVATGLRPAKDQMADMEILKEMHNAGTLRAIIDRIYPLDDIARAHTYVEAGHKKENVVISSIAQ